jgi:site-specific DNA recombinase
VSKRAAIYCRISRDAEQEGLGVKRQEEDCRALAERRGFTVVAVHVDNDLSASRFGKKERPEYKALMEAVAAGRVDVILAYDDSRITRRWQEKQAFIEAVIAGGAQVITVASGEDDLTTADGLMMARIRATVSANASDKTSERLRRKFLEDAQQGKVNKGTRPFGWADDKTALHPKESRLLRKAIQDVIDGVPTREIARRWNKAGLTTTRGKEWNHTAVRQVLRNPRLAGWRTHQKAVARDQDGQRVRGVWTPMVVQDTFDALQAALDGRRPKSRRGAQKYLLSGIVRCSVCASRMHGFRTKQGYSYACNEEGQDHTVTIAGRQTDDLLTMLVEQRLATVDLSAEPVQPQAWEGEARLAQIPKQVKELMAAFSEGVLSGAIVFPQVQALEAEQARLERERPKAAARPVVASPEAFPTLDLDRQRAIVDSLVEAVVVTKAERRGSPWTPDRLQVVWRA